MAKSKSSKAKGPRGRRPARATVRKSVKRPKTGTRSNRPARKAAAKKPAKTAAKSARAKAAPRKAAKSARRTTTTRLGKPPAPGQGTRTKAPALDRKRRTLEETVPTPPSSLDMARHSSAARSGRADLEHQLREHGSMTPGITGGDVDANWENAYFSGDEAPGGDNPTPDQEIVDDIGRALGVEYQDNEELKGADKVTARDKHRWELDPASAEDYRDRK